MYRFHNPDTFLIFASFEFFSKNGVLAWQVVSQRDVVIACSLLRPSFSFCRLFVPFDIFAQQIFPANFVEIPKMVDSFVRKEPYLIKSIVDELLFAPVDIPVVIFCLLVPPSVKGLLNTIGEEGFEFDIATG